METGKFNRKYTVWSPDVLQTTLGKSYFVYNKQVYLQLLGLFMGTNPAPILATVKMWKLERSAIYVDLRITLPTYSRFYDDLNGATSNSRRAQQLCTLIEQQDTDKLIKLTLDYPSSRDQFTPFLNTEVRISNEVKSSHGYSGNLRRNPSHYTTTLITLLAPRSLQWRVCTKQLRWYRVT